MYDGPFQDSYETLKIDKQQWTEFHTPETSWRTQEHITVDLSKRPVAGYLNVCNITHARGDVSSQLNCVQHFYNSISQSATDTSRIPGSRRDPLSDMRARDNRFTLGDIRRNQFADRRH
ncbi:hypothetical protein ColTof3_06532 [Colletotrichum tofieldiae]|nr:hypothetical protein ColTof3_06532 [Colletotrichum tofieldiae]